MARRRYLTTDISTDHDLLSVAEHPDGMFACLLYSWLILHATDDGVVPTGNLRELMVRVVPGFMGARTTGDLADALRLLEAHDLVVWWEGWCVEFPPDAFYKQQSYIPVGKRRKQPLDPADNPSKPPKKPANMGTDNHRQSPNMAEDRRGSPEKAASPSPSPSPSTHTPTGDTQQDTARRLVCVWDGTSEPDERKLGVAVTLVDRLPRVGELDDRQLADLVGWAKANGTRTIAGIANIAGAWDWPAPPADPWCGACEEHSRMVLADDGARRCSDCHPKRPNERPFAFAPESEKYPSGHTAS